ncbi:MAG: DUF3995 domain-containing protein [Rhodanobacter sp.]
MLVLIAAAHVYWANGGRRGVGAAIPELNGRPVLHPSAASTFAVALGLLAAAGLIALYVEFPPRKRGEWSYASRRRCRQGRTP